MHIYTFHSFCNKVIQENLELFGHHDLEQVSELERLAILREVIDDLKDPHPLKKGNDRYFYEGWLKELFRNMKTENWSAEHVLKHVAEYLEELPARDGFSYKNNSRFGKKGEIRQDKVDIATEKMQRLVAAAKLFPEYEKKMLQRGRYDFDDMILWVIKAFGEHPNLLRQYQEQYHYFLVDEYQDTNGAQNTILDQLIGYWEEPNVFIVGDDDQSIFEFQGARLQNLIQFYERYSDYLEPVVLQDNYRSTQEILTTAGSLIAKNEKRIVRHMDNVEKKLFSRNNAISDLGILPKFIRYKNRALEDVDIVASVLKDKEAGSPLDEIAIIYAQHRQVENLILLLEKENIPYSTRRKVNILDTLLIKKLRTLLEYLKVEQEMPFRGEFQLFKILYFDFLGIAPTDIALLSLYMANKTDDKKYWRFVLGDRVALEKAGVAAPEKFLQLSEVLEELISDVANRQLLGFLEKAVNKTGLIRQVLESEQKVWYLQLLHSFYDFARKEARKNPHISLGHFLEMLKSMEEGRIALTVQKTMETEKGVQLMTAHSSKGLEFQKVYILDCVNKFWEDRKGGSSRRFALPDTLTLSGEEDAREARRRLFYVAMTRAKTELHISFSEVTRDGKSLNSSVFVEEILTDNPRLHIEEKVVDPKLMIVAQEALLKESEKPKIVLPSKESIARILDNFQLSASALNSYLKCPIGFYYEYILRVPSVESEAAAYGTAIHFALKRLFDKMLLDESQQFPGLKKFLRFFEEEMGRGRGKFTAKEYERRKAIGRENLTKYYNHYISKWHKKVDIELDVKNVVFEKIPIKGAIDKVEHIDVSSVHIVDYKTGIHSKDKLRRPTAANPIGGSYWRQLVFYKILYESHKAHTKIAKVGKIAFIDQDKLGKIPEKDYVFTSEEVAGFKTMLRESYGSIMRQEFEEGCGEKKCKWCAFVKDHIVPGSFRNEETEAMDD